MDSTSYSALASPPFDILRWRFTAIDHKLSCLSLDTAIELSMDTKTTDHVVEVKERTNDGDNIAFPVLKEVLPGNHAPCMAKSVYFDFHHHVLVEKNFLLRRQDSNMILCT